MMRMSSAKQLFGILRYSRPRSLKSLLCPDPAYQLLSP